MTSAASTKSSFKVAAEFVRNLPKESDVKLSDDTRLLFYAWFKQASSGGCSANGGSQPYAINVVARAKYDAWNKLGDLSKEDAENAYVAKLIEITKDSKQHKFLVQ